MTELIKYDGSRRSVTVGMIAAFFADHSSITSDDKVEITPKRIAYAEEDLDEWTVGDNILFIIGDDGSEAGFIRMNKHGDAAWIEDIYVKAEFRGRGIATRAITLAEKYAYEVMGSDSVSLDVIPRNVDAIRLYHSLGYDNMPLITLRKFANGKKSDTPVDFNGFGLFI